MKAALLLLALAAGCAHPPANAQNGTPSVDATSTWTPQPLDQATLQPAPTAAPADSQTPDPDQPVDVPTPGLHRTDANGYPLPHTLGTTGGATDSATDAPVDTDEPEQRPTIDVRRPSDDTGYTTGGTSGTTVTGGTSGSTVTGGADGAH